MIVINCTLLFFATYAVTPTESHCRLLAQPSSPDPLGAFDNRARELESVFASRKNRQGGRDIPTSTERKREKERALRAVAHSGFNLGGI